PGARRHAKGRVLRGRRDRLHGALSPLNPAADLKMILCLKPGRTFAQSDVLMARLHPGGLFELLTAEAWARALGYPSEELCRRSLRELIALEAPAASAVIAALLDTAHAEPLDVTLRCDGVRLRCFRFHRRFDPQAQSIYFVIDEIPMARG